MDGRASAAKKSVQHRPSIQKTSSGTSLLALGCMLSNTNPTQEQTTGNPHTHLCQSAPPVLDKRSRRLRKTTSSYFAGTCGRRSYCHLEVCRAHRERCKPACMLHAPTAKSSLDSVAASAGKIPMS